MTSCALSSQLPSDLRLNLSTTSSQSFHISRCLMKVHWEHSLCDCSPRDCLLARHHTGRLRYWQISNRGLPESHQTTLSILPASKSPKLLHYFLKSSDPISQINLAFLKKKYSKMISRHRIDFQDRIEKGTKKDNALKAVATLVIMLWQSHPSWSVCCPPPSL